MAPKAENTDQHARRMATQGPKGDNPRQREINASKGKHKLFYEGEERRRLVLEAVASGSLVKDAVKDVGVTYGTYERWRSRFPQWAARVDEARLERSPDANFAGPRTLDRAFDVAQLRLQYFEHDTPAFQMEVLDAMMHIPPGNILMVLFPPEHGKTTMYEDFKTLDIAHNPHTLGHVGSESRSLSQKILGKIRNRLDPPPGATKLLEFVNRYGPFAPQGGGRRKTKQPWSSTHFDVYRKGEFDDRDYTMAALGFGSQIIGSRSLHLHCDDLQSMNTLSQTETMIDTFQQDWLSRPGETGFTTVFGNRVDDDDIYGEIEERFDPDILQIIRYPARISDPVTGEVRPLWPERWPEWKLERMQRKVEAGPKGPERWARNWMQQPRPKQFLAFTDAMIDKNKNPHLSLTKGHPSHGRICYLTLDPAIGGRTAIMILQITHAGRIRPVYLRDIPGLRSNEDIISHCESAARWAIASGFTVTDFIIEAKNFQAGLARDERLLDLCAQTGMNAREHLTGWNKYDENVGVASMVTTFVKGEIELPWADDHETRELIGLLRSQLMKWRPGKGGGGTNSARGNKLRQDLVMALWFGWILWRQIGKKEDEQHRNGSQFKTTALPYAPTGNGLLVPTKYTPTMIGSGR